MTNQWKKTEQDMLIAVFAEQNEARKALRDLRASGFTESQLGLAYHEEELTRHIPVTEAGSYADEGALAGAVAGAGIGGLWAIGIAGGMLPAIGPAIAGGLLTSLLASSAVGAGAGTLGGSLMGAGIPEEHVEYYETELREGRTLITVHTPTPDLEEKAINILRDNNAYNRDTVVHA